MNPSKAASVKLTLKPFNLKKAKKGKPFTWIEHMIDGRLNDTSQHYDILYLLGESKTNTYGEGMQVVQAQAWPDEEDDECLYMTIKELETYCCMLPKGLKELDNPEIFTKLGKIQ